jgi:hypothetical protein
MMRPAGDKNIAGTNIQSRYSGSLRPLFFRVIYAALQVSIYYIHINSTIYQKEVR